MGTIPNSPFTPTPVGGTSNPLPVAQTPAYQQQNAKFAIQNQLASQFGLGDIFSLPGDVWGWIKDHAGDLVPRDAQGNIDWGKIGGSVKDLASWLSAHKRDIIDGLSLYSQYERGKLSDQYTKEALDLAKQSYADKAPLRVAGQAGMLNPQANAPDLSALKAKIPTPTAAPLPVAGANQNLRNAQQIAGPGSGNAFAKPLPIAPSTPTGSSGTPSAGLPIAPSSPSGSIPLGGGVSFTPRLPKTTPLPVAGTPVAAQPAHYLINGLDQDASGNAVPGGYNALSDLYQELGTTPGSVGDPRILALAKSNPKLIDALPPEQAATLRRTMASVGA